MKSKNHQITSQGIVGVLTLLLFFFSSIAFSQTEDFCATADKIDPDPINVYNLSSIKTLQLDLY